jgi:hypothetical protein
MTAVTPISTADATPTSNPTQGGDAAAFQAAVAKILPGGMMTIMNSVVGDTIDGVNEPFGDPDDQPF